MESNIDNNGNLIQIQLKNISKAIKNLSDTILSIYTSDATLSFMHNSISATFDRLKDVYGDGIKGYEQWGKLGWSFSPSMDPDMFRNAPMSVAEANQTMQEFMTDDEISKIVRALRSAEVNQEELNEADICFKNGAYKACALVLFGIIDNKLFQYDFKKTGSKQITLIGKPAAVQLENKHKFEDFYLNMKFLNITTALKTIFENGNNFEKNMTIINRNYISHGMSRRSISKLECFQIWCLAFSTIVYIDILDKCCNEALDLK